MAVLASPSLSVRLARRRPRAWTMALCLLTSGFLPIGAKADDLADAQNHFRLGNYTEVIRDAQRAHGMGTRDAGWTRIETEALLASGQYRLAYNLISRASAQDPRNVRFLLLARQAALFSGHEKEAEDYLAQMSAVISTGLRYTRDPDALVAY